MAWADSPDPVQNSAVGRIIANPPGAPANAVTISVEGNWTWPTHRSDCNTNRFAAGYAVDWNDPKDPGPFTLTGKDKQGNPISADPGTAADPYTHYNGGKSDDQTGGPRCGTYANPPGYNSGHWGPIEHTYVDPPATIKACVVTYDLHEGNATHPFYNEAGITSNDIYTNAHDNSIQSNGSTPGGNQCANIPIAKPLSLEVTKTNNADPSNAYSDDETAATADQDVPFRVTIKNTSTSDSVKLTSITDSVDGGAAFNVCTAGAIGNNLIDAVLAPGATTTVPCEFTLAKYSPAAGTAKPNTVVVSGVSTTDNRSVSGQDSSIVRTAAARPDLIVGKSGPATALQGQTVKYTITVDNVGGAVAPGPIHVVDDLPAGEAYVSASGNNFNGLSCTPTGAAGGHTLVSCSLPPSLAPADAPLSFDVTVTFAANAAGHYTDCATLDNGNFKCATTSVIPVSVTKTNNADGKPGYNKSEVAPAANQDVPFQVQVHNDGTLPITIKTLTDEWPGQAAKPICAGLIGTTVAAGGDSAVCDFTEAGYSPADGASKTNTVHLVAYEFGVPANTATAEDTSTVTTNVAKGPLLTIDKDRTDANGNSLSGTVVSGTEAFYTLKVTNKGTAAQTARFTVTDTLPAEEIFVSASVPCTATAGPRQVVSCDLDTDLAVNASTSFTVKVRFTDTASGNFEDCAKVDNSEDCYTTPVSPPLTLRVDKTNNANQDLAFSDVETAKTVGQDVVFHALITNLSKVDVQLDSITDAIGNGVSTVVCSGNNGNVLAANGGNVLCAFTITGYAPATGSLVDTVTANGHEVKNAKNTVTASDQSTVLAPGGAPSLVVLKTGPASAMPGSQADYTIKVTNNGTATANAPLVVTDTLPAGETFVSSSLGGNACTSTAGPGQTVVTCTLQQSLVAGADTSFTVRVQFAASATGTLTDCAAIGASQSCVPTTMPDLKIVKTGATIARPGDTLPYTLTITNTGPVPASGFTVTDTMPAGLTLGQITQGGFTCLAGGAINCTFPGTLAPGASTVLSFSATLADPYTLPSVSNTAVVGPTDTTPGDNTSTWITPVEQRAVTPPDLGIEKNGPALAKPGEDLVYTLTVTNTGTVPASGFTVTDPLAIELFFNSASGPGFICTGPGVSCTYPGVLNPGDKAVVTVSTTLSGGFGGNSVTNTATVGPNDGTPDDNTSTWITPVQQPAVINPDLGITKTADVASVAPGGNVTYTLTVRNTGLVSASGFTVSDELPAALTLVSLSGSGFTCDMNAVRCTYDGTLAPTETASVSVVATLSSGFSGTSIKNVAVVAPTDGTPDDNRAEVTTPVNQPSPPPLPFTGSNTYQMLLSALTLLSVGAALVLAGRRRRREI